MKEGFVSTDIKTQEKIADTGFVIGKFYPPHRGHKLLIDTASSYAKHVSVVVCDKDEKDIPGKLRAAWVKQIHPEVEVMLRDDRLPTTDSKRWAEQTYSWLGYTPQIVFTSEDYGEPYSHFLGAKHVAVDRDRKAISVSGTKVRNRPLDNLDFLEPVVRVHFVKRICVLVAESTGTTTMAQALAAYYQTLWVPEYGREYSTQKMKSGGSQDWESWEFEHIASEQMKNEDKSAGFANKVLIEDTNAFATAIWCERYTGRKSDKVEALADQAKADLYLLTAPDIPFVQDGTRDGAHIRQWMHKRFIDELRNRNLPYLILSGSHRDRMKEATSAVSYLLAQ